MTSIHPAQELFLQTLEELAELVRGERSFGELEEAVQRLAGRVTLRLLEWVLAGVDERLMRERNRADIRAWIRGSGSWTRRWAS